MAYYHFGVLLALLEAKLLPGVICGSSGGSLVAAIAGTRTDRELLDILNTGLHRVLTPCNESYLTLIRYIIFYWRFGRAS